MLSSLVLGLALSLPSQAATDDVMLDLIPAQADVVIRVRGIDATRADLVTMIEAMSPTAAQSATPVLLQGQEEFASQFGQEATKVPFVAAMRVIQPENPNQPPFVVVVPGADDQAILGSLPGGGIDQEQQPGGYISLQGPQGATWYSCKGEGWVAFGGDELLIAAIAKKGEESFSNGLTKHQREQFLGGDLGVAVSLSALVDRYGEQIDAAEEQFMAALDQAATTGGNADAMEVAKGMYGQLFDSADQLDRLVIQFDFDKAGLDLTGELSVKPGSEIAKLFANSTPGTSVELGSMPNDMAYYMAYHVSAEQTAKIQAWGMRTMGTMMGGETAVADALKAMGDQGSVRTIASARIADGIYSVNLIESKDPNGYLAASTEMMKAMLAGDKDGPTAFVKSVEVKPDAEAFMGYNFTSVVLEYDLEKMTAMQGPANAQAMGSVKAILGDGVIRSWMAADDQRMVTVSARTGNRQRGCSKRLCPMSRV